MVVENQQYLMSLLFDQNVLHTVSEKLGEKGGDFEN